MEILQENLKIKDDEIDGPQMLTWEQIVEMSKGGVDFGSHTVNYPNLTKISLLKLKKRLLCLLALFTAGQRQKWREK